MNPKTILRAIGIAEILIGGVTLLTNFVSLALSLNPKSTNVFIFVTVTGTLSTLIGIGILMRDKLAYQGLLYFASVIILSKVLIFAGIIHLNGALESTLPGDLKNSVSIAYHGSLLYLLSRPAVKKIFCNS